MLTAALVLGGCTDGRAVAGTGLGAPSIDHVDLGPVSIGSRPRDVAFPVPVIDAAETSLPVCEDSATRVVGPAGRPCAGMDSACSRGVRDVAGCCRLEPRFHGTGCGDGMECDMGGDCVATSSAPWEASSIVGDQTWLDIVGDGEDSLITLDPTGFQARLDNASLVDVHPDDGAKVNVGDVHIAHGRDRGLEAVAIAAPGDVSRRSVYLLTTPASAEVCVVRGDFDTMGPVSADCDSPGATRVRCPAGDAETVCLVLRDGGVRITGENLALVFEMGTFGAQPPGADVRHALTVDSLDHRWRTTTTIAALTAVDEQTTEALDALLPPVYGCTPRCAPGRTLIRHQRGCAGAAVQTRSCNVFGCWGAWQNAPEICDGKDNDCDGDIDEGGGAALCNDNIGCTADVCGRPIHGPTRCTNTPFPALCALPGSVNDQECILPRCLGNGPFPNYTEVGNVLTPEDPATGCSYLYRNTYCTNTWDSCDCNGLDLCLPGPNMVDASGCNNSPRMTGHPAGTGPNALSINWPCERDGEYCTFGLCCENDVRCRDLELAFPDPTERRESFDMCPGTVHTLSVTGKYVECGSQLFAEVEPPDLCDGACTEQTCMEPSVFGPPWKFFCAVTGFVYGSPDGCDGPANEGCGKYECGDGTTGRPEGVCGTLESGLSVTECSQSSYLYNGAPSCMGAHCVSDTCERFRDDFVCEALVSLPCAGTAMCDASDNSSSAGDVFGCVRHIMGDFCVIDDMCVPIGTFMSDDRCWQCSGGYDWSPSTSTTLCNDDDPCTNNDHCNGGGRCVGTYITGCFE